MIDKDQRLLTLLMIFLILIVIGCQLGEYLLIIISKPTESGDMEFSTICVDGVEYIFRENYTSRTAWMAPHFKTDGSLYLCEVEQLR